MEEEERLLAGASFCLSWESADQWPASKVILTKTGSLSQVTSKNQIQTYFLSAIPFILSLKTQKCYEERGRNSDCIFFFCSPLG